MANRLLIAGCIAVCTAQTGAAQNIFAAPSGTLVPGTGPQIPKNLQITTFASGIDSPYGLYALPDGSILTATTPGGFYSGAGVSIQRMTHTNGVANPATEVFRTTVPGPATGMAGVGDIVAVAMGVNTGSEIKLLKAGPNGTMTELTSIAFTYPSSDWWHPASTVAMRAVPGQPNAYQMIFNVGSRDNQFPSTGTIGAGGLVNGELNSNSIYSVTFEVNGSTVTPSPPKQLATGLRNAFALSFNAAGDVYFGENGIDLDGFTPKSTDYFGIIPAGTEGILNFGFPSTYYDPVTGMQMGPGDGVTQPFAKFLPINGMRSQGVAGMAVGGDGFLGMQSGAFFGFAGRYVEGGENDLSGIVYVDDKTGERSFLVPNSQSGLSRPLSLLATSDALYFADAATDGRWWLPGGGVIYRVSLSAVPEPATVSLFAVGLLISAGAVRVRRRRIAPTEIHTRI
jgi:glucose/arabinose dehydrogenase